MALPLGYFLVSSSADVSLGFDEPRKEGSTYLRSTRRVQSSKMLFPAMNEAAALAVQCTFEKEMIECSWQLPSPTSRPGDGAMRVPGGQRKGLAEEQKTSLPRHPVPPRSVFCFPRIRPAGLFLWHSAQAGSQARSHSPSASIIRGPELGTSLPR